MHFIWTSWSFIVSFDIATHKELEIFQLPESTEHGTFAMVSYGQKYPLRSNIQISKIKSMKYNVHANEK